jgi:hypothetical protein
MGHKNHVGLSEPLSLVQVNKPSLTTKTIMTNYEREFIVKHQTWYYHYYIRKFLFCQLINMP